MGMNILTFDIEEWFHILDHGSTKTEADWQGFESRIHRNMDTIFEILEQRNLKATFFCLGWVAREYPEVIKRIDENGYEVASHSYMHQLAFEQDRKTYTDDLVRSIKELENLTGKKVVTYRAPGFSIGDENKWALEVLAELGIERDASIFPAERAHGGFANFRAQEPCLIKFGDHQLKEFPINTFRFMNKDLVFSGGGYFRLMPYSLVKRLSKKSDYIMTYFHPRDFDAGQPMIKDLPLSRKFKSYVGLKGCRKKLEKWLDQFEFTDIETADRNIDWGAVKTIEL